jgi:hypothetical protein
VPTNAKREKKLINAPIKLGKKKKKEKRKKRVVLKEDQVPHGFSNIRKVKIFEPSKKKSKN